MATTKKATKKTTKKTTKKATKKKSTKKPAAKRAVAKADANTEQIMLEAIAELRNNPEKYRELRKALKGAKTDKARVKHFIQYATRERDLAALLPPTISPDPGEERRRWTTVTITTIIVI
ncbi:MAG TPA: hypothetical protein VE842_14230 [Pyrinomonadaceae bacterium]|jgi:cell division septation protein DedD|nr:hypothetical protein [Pyrinomonadaceae bacterium]